MLRRNNAMPKPSSRDSSNSKGGNRRTSARLSSTTKEKRNSDVIKPFSVPRDSRLRPGELRPGSASPKLCKKKGGVLIDINDDESLPEASLDNSTDQQQILSPPDELVALKAQIEHESRHGVDPQRMAMLIKRLALLSEALTDSVAAASAAAHNTSPSTAQSPDLPSLCATSGLWSERYSISIDNHNNNSSNSQKQTRKNDRMTTTTTTQHNNRNKMDNGSRNYNDSLSEATHHEPKYQADVSSRSDDFDLKTGVVRSFSEGLGIESDSVKLGFALAYYSQGSIGPKVVNTGVLYENGVDVVAMDLGFAISYVPRPRFDRAESEAECIQSYVDWQDSTRSQSGIMPVCFAHMLLDNENSLISDLIRTHMEHWIALEHLKRSYHGLRMAHEEAEYKKGNLRGSQSMRRSLKAKAAIESTGTGRLPMLNEEYRYSGSATRRPPLERMSSAFVGSSNIRRPRPSYAVVGSGKKSSRGALISSSRSFSPASNRRRMTYFG